MVTTSAVMCEDGTSNNQLFHGMSFFLAHRIPSRSLIIQMITTNGGVIVNLEKNADLIIADHARKDSKSGSISWTFIEDSVKTGRLEDIEDHRAAPITGTPNELQYSSQRKKTRTPFTVEDDMILWDFCMNAKKKGADLKGNNIYRDLEKINRRHTAQSWRDRYIKYVSTRKPSENHNESKDQDESRLFVDKNLEIKSDVSCHQKVSRDETMSNHKNTQRRNVNFHTKLEVTNSSQSEVTRQKIFTQQDTDALVEAYPRMINLRQDENIEVWVQWQKDHANHTAQEWRNYFSDHVQPMYEALIAKNSEQKQLRKSSRLRNKQGKTQKPISSSSSSSSYHLENGPLEKLTTKVTTSHQMVGRGSKEDLEDTQSLTDPSSLVSDPMLHNEKLFRQGLRDLANELDLEINFHPEICGEKVSLMKLWQIVRSPVFGGFERVSENNQWQKVAEKLGFTDNDNSSAEELKDCYSEILADLENLRNEFLYEKLLTELQENNFIEDQLLPTIACPDGTLVDSDNMPQLSIETPLVQHDSDDLDLIPTPENPHESLKEKTPDSYLCQETKKPRKRLKISKNKDKVLEIPSTPEDVINGFQDPIESHQKSKKYIVISDNFDGASFLDEHPDHLLKSRKSDAIKFSSIPRMDLESTTTSFVENDHRIHLRPSPKAKNMSKDSYEFQHLKRLGNEKPSSLTVETQINATSIEKVEEFQRDSPNPDISCDSSILSEKMCKSNEGSPCSQISRRKKQENSSLFLQSRRTKTDKEDQEEDRFESFIQKQIDLGYPEKIIITALEATTLSIGPESHINTIMDSLKSKNQIPEDIPGVWTTSDDDILKNILKSHTNPIRDKLEAFQVIIQKHGLENVRLRQGYLRDIEEVEQEFNHDNGENW